MNAKTRIGGALLALAITSSLAVAQRSERGDITVGDTTLEFVPSGGMLRWYRVYVPPGTPPGQELPVVVCFHGGGGSARYAIEQYGVAEEARDRGWIAVFPEGTGVFGGPPHFRGQTWNGGDCCGYAFQNGIDDVQFFVDMLAKLDVTYEADVSTVCLTGISNGGIMSYRIAVDRPDLVTAIAPVAASLQTVAPTQPVSLLVIFGLQDSYIPIGGGSGVGGPQVFTSQADTITPFLNVNGRAFEPALRTPTVRLRVSNASSQGGADTWVFLALDGGHTWPGTPGLPSDPDEPVHMDIPASPLMFDFFELQLLR
ncbi:MAG: hypothetical protein AAF957_15405 [Planctomycetota bacterium]